MHRVLIGVVVAGAVIIAGIGFAGSYAAVRELALKKGFGNFSYVFPIGIDAGICVLLALDLLLTWIRIPFPLLRQTAWLLTAATIAFNGAAAWPDPLGVGMHGVIPILFVVSVEAARHAIGRIADITADKHMEGVRLTRWMLSPVPTFLLWRRMKLWELRSYEQVIKLEQERLVYQARLRSRFGRAWRRKAPVESLMPLRLARYGVPLAETAPAGLAAAGIEPALIPPAPQQALDAAGPKTLAANSAPAPAAGSRAAAAGVGAAAPTSGQRPELDSGPHAEHLDSEPEPEPDQSPWFNTPRDVEYQGGYDPAYDPDQYAQWIAEPSQAERHLDQPQETLSPEDTGSFPIPVGPNRTRELGDGGGTPPAPAPAPDEESYYQVFKQSINGSYPTPRELIDNVGAEFGIALAPDEAKRMVNRFTNRHNAELEEDHIA
ncbi:integral membrane protein [Streptomyces viridochromogenes DSM 40736]|uniref:Integral membrane protein n=1 Tax=Streptomyces viridochromogenes (strain DSM 40736 / JCM 4977 / BCRC 1201 / Tue 494) TaxID=591159 RepID=D9X6Q9_STRVT|nr:DUF2637 domain-containing protein [Streptomyces viridochromogenes]EFL33976.1 integral membrane protein [Streptomyces viridochromogenes DSM 40736]